MDPITIVLLLILLALPGIPVLKWLWKKRKLAYYVNQLPGPPTYPFFGTSYKYFRTPRKRKFPHIRLTLLKRFKMNSTFS